jgi:hypothetical protein
MVSVGVAVMNQHSNEELAHAKQAVVDLFTRGGKKALFATEVLAGLRRFNLGKDELDRTLAELQAEGALVLRDNFCADPHLAEVDLRVIALLDAGAGDDSHRAALHEIDLAWNRWLGEFLANHRCG